MGLFDYLRCDYPLPQPSDNEREYQTKDTPEQFMERYRIERDGTLVCETSAGEDLPKPLIVDYTGEVRFYDFIDRRFLGGASGWIEFSAYFERGRLARLNEIERRDARSNEAEKKPLAESSGQDQPKPGQGE